MTGLGIQVLEPFISDSALMTLNPPSHTHNTVGLPGSVAFFPMYSLGLPSASPLLAKDET